MKCIIITLLVTLAIVSAFDSVIWRRLAQHFTKSRQNSLSSDDIEEVVKGNTDFAFDFFSTVDEEQGNVIFSPYSISAALGMTFAGAKGVTERQMKNTLHFENPNVHAVFRDLNTNLFKSRDGLEVKVANSLWSDKAYPFKEDYVDLVRNLYQGEVRSVDFQKQSEVARLAINDWTAEKTNGKIQDILASKLDTDTKLILVNAIYFKSAWMNPFETIGRHAFYMFDDKYTFCNMMKVKQRMSYFKGSGFRSVSLPYKGSEAFMTIILPDAGEFSEVKKNLNSDTLSNIFKYQNVHEVEVIMPKFKIETELKLKENFEELGMENPFTEGEADFSKMDGTKNLFIGDVIHKAFIEVDENGTEAAAATAIINPYLGSAVYSYPIKLRIDHPFFYVIHDENNSVLFMGQVIKP